MRSYGQYCPMARASEILAERWTPIILRNLLSGAETFTELRAGAPGIPKALLADRLSTLVRAGLVTRSETSPRNVRYALTPAGRDAKSVCDAMGAWGMRWLEVTPSHLDPDYVLWATARLVDPDTLPPGPVTVRVDLSDSGARRYWLLLRRPQPEVCTRYPGPEDLVLHTDTHSLARWHLRQASFARLTRAGQLTLEGPRPLVRAFPSWLRPSPYAADATEAPGMTEATETQTPA